MMAIVGPSAAAIAPTNERAIPESFGETGRGSDARCRGAQAIHYSGGRPDPCAGPGLYCRTRAELMPGFVTPTRKLRGGGSKSELRVFEAGPSDRLVSLAGDVMVALYLIFADVAR